MGLVSPLAGVERSMCCTGDEVAGPGEQRRRPLDADAGGDEGAVATTSSSLFAAPMLSRRRQAEEMAAMVSALASVVAGGGGTSLPAKRPAEREPEEGAAVEGVWWSYCSELAAAAAAPSPAAPFPAGTYVYVCRAV